MRKMGKTNTLKEAIGIVEVAFPNLFGRQARSRRPRLTNMELCVRLNEKLTARYVEIDNDLRRLGDDFKFYVGEIKLASAKGHEAAMGYNTAQADICDSMFENAVESSNRLKRLIDALFVVAKSYEAEGDCLIIPVKKGTREVKVRL